jgi:hypothetical protein
LHAVVVDEDGGCAALARVGLHGLFEGVDGGCTGKWGVVSMDGGRGRSCAYMTCSRPSL